MEGKRQRYIHEKEEEEEEEEEDLEEFGLTYNLQSVKIKKKLLVLDVNGLLCQKIFRYDKAKLPNSSSVPVIECGSFLVYKRPYCDEFMNFCLERFEVGIWSTAREGNLNSVLDCIMEGLKSKLLFVWDQSHCTSSGFYTLEKKGKPIFLKDLKKLWKNINAILPESKGQFSKSNTLLIDDKPYKALLNPLHSAIFPDEYKADNVDDASLGPKGELRLYLEELADADNVTCFVEERPFGQPPITPTHSQWDFYSKIVHHFQKSS
ncbi:Uncharacterized FCP1-like domain-containing protein [Morus notabilis]|uniref:Mitochondrial import inner membrane translocase subunit TIM50 n=2 Tax=Morus notabilis TaxID=981085 RepID=W9S5G9_9ROSA|nr:Uncharacterized FCP1-like domain-containing protein [Morus notabilis]